MLALSGTALADHHHGATLDSEVSAGDPTTTVDGTARPVLTVDGTASETGTETVDGTARDGDPTLTVDGTARAEGGDCWHVETVDGTAAIVDTPQSANCDRDAPEAE